MYRGIQEADLSLEGNSLQALNNQGGEGYHQHILHTPLTLELSPHCCAPVLTPGGNLCRFSLDQRHFGP